MWTGRSQNDPRTLLLWDQRQVQRVSGTNQAEIKGGSSVLKDSRRTAIKSTIKSAGKVIGEVEALKNKSAAQRSNKMFEAKSLAID